jgi:ArsR family transcriptional regulator, arsenate/arsenite/antimonite-responsive transcriptional repressor
VKTNIFNLLYPVVFAYSMNTEHIRCDIKQANSANTRAHHPKNSVRALQIRMSIRSVTLFCLPCIEWLTAGRISLLRHSTFEGPAMDSIEESDAQQIARALGDPTRFAIYKHLAENDEIRCGDICLDTPVRAPTVSHHLKVLTDAGLIISRREGQGVYYRAVPERLKAYLKYLRKMARAEQLVQSSSPARPPHRLR